MSMSTKPATLPPTSEGSGKTSLSSDASKSSGPRQQFVGMALNMTWQLAITVLVPVIGAVELGKHLGNPTAWVLIGLAVAVIGSGAVMWRAVQTANRLPLPRLTEAEKRAVQKSYEEDDD